MRKFERHHICPKCLMTCADVVFKTEPEHLACHCFTCGFKWRMHTAESGEPQRDVWSGEPIKNEKPAFELIPIGDFMKMDFSDEEK